MSSFSLPTLSPKHSRGGGGGSCKSHVVPTGHEEDMVDRLAKIQYENPICADCPTTCPRWVSFLRDHFSDGSDESSSNNNKEGHVKLEVEGKLCVVVCDNCAIQHHDILSKKRCMIKSLECIHEWTHNEVDIVLGSGNELTNLFYEADLLISKSLIAEDEEMLPNFIKQKYKTHKFRDDEMLKNYLRVARKKGIKKAKKRFLSGDNKSSTRAGNSRRKTCAGRETRRSKSAPKTALPTEEQGSCRGSVPTLMEEHVPDTTSTTANQRNNVRESRGGRAGSVGMLPVPNDSCYRRRSSRTSRVASKAIGKIPVFLSYKSISTSSMQTSSTSEEYNGNEGVPVSINASETKSVSSLGSFGSSATRTTAFSEECHNKFRDQDVDSLGSVTRTTDATSNCSEGGSDADDNGECYSTQTRKSSTSSTGSRRSQFSLAKSDSLRSVTWGEDSVLSMCSDEPPMSCQQTLRRVQTLPTRPRGGILRKT